MSCKALLTSSSLSRSSSSPCLLLLLCRKLMLKRQPYGKRCCLQQTWCRKKPGRGTRNPKKAKRYITAQRTVHRTLPNDICTSIVISVSQSRAVACDGAWACTCTCFAIQCICTCARRHHVCHVTFKYCHHDRHMETASVWRPYECWTICRYCSQHVEHGTLSSPV